MSDSKCFQDHILGSVHFGYETNYDELQSKSFWDGKKAVY